MVLVSRIVMMSIMSVLIPTAAVLTKDFSNIIADPMLFILMFILMFCGISIQNRFISTDCNSEFNMTAASMNASMYVIAASFGYILYNTFFPEDSNGVLFSILKSFFVLVPANMWYYFQDKVYVYKCDT